MTVGSNKKRLLHTSIIVFVVLFLSFLCSSPVYSQSRPGVKPKKETPGGLGISLIQNNRPNAKPYFQYELAPGRQVRDAIIVFNNSKKPIEVSLYAADAINGKNGSLTGRGKKAPKKSVSTWINLRKHNAKIQPGQNSVFQFTFKVPENSPPGDHFGFIFIEPENQGSKKKEKKPDAGKSKDKVTIGMEVRYRIGVSVWQRTPGTENREIVFSDIKKEFKKGKIFLVFSLENKGNIFVKPILGWKLKDDKGKVYINQDPRLVGYVLPNNKISVPIPLLTRRPLPKGKYILETSLGDEKSDYKESRTYELQLP